MATPIYFNEKPKESALGGNTTQADERWKLFLFFEQEMALAFVQSILLYNTVWEVHNGNEFIGILRRHNKKGPFLFWKFEEPLLLPLPSKVEKTDCGKVAYATFDMALKTLKDMPNRVERQKQPIRAYKCHDCGLYHLTSTLPNH